MCILSLAVLLSMAGPAAAQPPRSYLVMAKDTSLPAGLAKALTQAGGTVRAALPQIGLVVVDSNDPRFTAKAAKVAGVRSVVPNPTLQWLEPEVRVAFDAEYGNPPFSGDNDTRFDLQWGHDAVDAPEAWNLGYRGAGVRVAVLDTGFDLDHPDLAPNINMALSTSFVTGEGLSYALPDAFSHGTHTAGTIAAADNGFGTIGVAPEAELLLVKVLADSGSGSFSWIIQGIVYAAQNGADVINMSLGATVAKSGWTDDEGTVAARDVAELLVALGRATNYAYQNGSTLIAAAGNDAIDFDHTADWVHVPSASPHVISISATTPVGWATAPTTAYLDYPASYTNFGTSAISLAAPGGDAAYPGNENCTIGGLLRPCWVFDMVFSTGSNLNPGLASYYWSSGTSMAAPHATGVAAIVIGKNGGSMAPSQVEAALVRSADDLWKPGKDRYYGHGRVNAFNAVR